MGQLQPTISRTSLEIFGNFPGVFGVKVASGGVMRVNNSSHISAHAKERVNAGK
jgi:hypothetical protein